MAIITKIMAEQEIQNSKIKIQNSNSRFKIDAKL
jgi:hypothetical protein